MSSNVDLAACRLRPGGPALAAGTPGSVVKFTFTSSASAVQVLRTVGIGTIQFIEVKTTAAVHLCVGDSTVGAPTNAEWLIEPGDSAQPFYLKTSDTHFRVKGDSAGGDIYIGFLTV